MITTKQRATLRKFANPLTPVFQVGKAGITDNVITSVREALTARELVKFKVLENSCVTAREACETLSEILNAEQIQVVGRVFVLYKENPDIKSYVDALKL